MSHNKVIGLGALNSVDITMEDVFSASNSEYSSLSMVSGQDAPQCVRSPAFMHLAALNCTGMLWSDGPLLIGATWLPIFAEYVRRYATPSGSAAGSSKASDDGSEDKMDEDGQQQDAGESDGFLSSSEEEED